ncbi:MAG: hypothetical protein ACN4GW_16275 [Desulforhopalus sp.]
MQSVKVSLGKLNLFQRTSVALSHFEHGKLDNYTLVRQIVQEAVEFDEKYAVPYALMAWTHYYDERQGGF